MFAAFFTVVGLWPLVAGPARFACGRFGRGRAFLVVALLAPGTLRPLNKAWSRLGSCWAGSVSPIVLALMFFLVFTPGAFLFRVSGKDMLRLRRTPGDTYGSACSPGLTCP